MASTKSPVIEFKDVTFSFKFKNKTQTILKNFNFSIFHQDKVIIYGKSGSGKTTLLELILGFKRPQSGTIFVNRQPLTPKNIWKIRKYLAYVDQDAIVGQGEIKKLIAEYFSFQNNKKIGLDWIKVKNLLDKFELNQEILTKTSDGVSGGERQRLALIMALLLNRPIMLLDEATSSLDITARKIVIRELLNKKDLTLISVSHDNLWLKQPGLRIFNFKEKKWLST